MQPCSRPIVPLARLGAVLHRRLTRLSTFGHRRIHQRLNVLVAVRTALTLKSEDILKAALKSMARASRGGDSSSPQPEPLVATPRTLHRAAPLASDPLTPDLCAPL